MRQGYGSQSNLSGWRFSVGSVPLNERRSREGNGEKVRALQGGTGRRDVRRKNGDGVGKGWEFLSRILISLFVSRSLTLRSTPLSERLE